MRVANCRVASSASAKRWLYGPRSVSAMRNKANMLDEQLSPEGWLEQLNAEANAKMAGLRRQKLGFVA